MQSLPATPEPSIVRTLANSCEGLPLDFEPPTIQIHPKVGQLGGGFVFGVDEVTPIAYPDATFRFTPNVPQPEGFLPGGHPIPAELWLWYPFSVDRHLLEPVKLKALSITATPERATPTKLDLSTDKLNFALWDIVADGLPDVDGTAAFDIAVEWTDRCFAYAAHSTVNASLVSSTTTAGCRIDPDSDLFFDDLRRTFDQEPLLIDGQPVDFFWRWADARYLPVGGPGGDGPAPYQVWDRDAAPIVTSPSAVLRASEDNPNVEIPSARSTFFRRADVVDALDHQPAYPPPNIDPVLEGTPARQADGSFRVRVPDAPGRYVVWLELPFESTCATGTAWSLFTIKVVEPSPSPSSS